jgi:imidazolonepropionase-like amidohydrolase
MAERIILRDANLIDGQNPAVAGQTVVVEGNRITQVGAQAAPAQGDRVIELGGKTLMPGMVQSHFHAGFGAFGAGTSAPILGLEASPPYFGMLAAKNANTALQCGFTSIIGSSNGDYLDVALKEAIIAGLVEGPRSLACTREFMCSGDMADGKNRSWFMDIGHSGLTRVLDGAEAFRQAAREELGRGCDVVKLSVSPGHGSAPAPELCYVSEDEIRAVVDVAHDRGKLVRAHVASKVGILRCAATGVDIIDHADKLDAECIDAMSKAGSTVVPSMLWYERFLGLAENWDHAQQVFPIGDGFPEALEDTLARIRGVREDFDYTCSMLPELARSDVRIVVGDDFGTPLMPHGDYASELGLYVKQLGISAIDVLRWATKNGAEAMGRGDELGTIEAGKLADLLVVDGDPISDIGVLADPARMPAIMKDGEFVRDFLG